MADLKEEVADLGEKAIGFASNLFKRSTEVARQQARIVGLQTQIMRLRDDKARLYCLMGQKVYALFEKGLVKNADLLALCEQAKEMDRQVDAAEEEIQQLRTGVEVKTQVQDTEGGIEAEPPSAGTKANTSASPAEPFPLPPPPSEPEPPAL
jgi:hypothetical protein